MNAFYNKRKAEALSCLTVKKNWISAKILWKEPDFSWTEEAVSARGSLLEDSVLCQARKRRSWQIWNASEMQGLQDFLIPGVPLV